MRRGRQIRITHAEVDDIGASVSRGGLGPVDLLEHIGRQSADAVEFFHGIGLQNRFIMRLNRFFLSRKPGDTSHDGQF
jgi:hypothetical protein